MAETWIISVLCVGFLAALAEMWLLSKSIANLERQLDTTHTAIAKMAERVNKLEDCMTFEFENIASFKNYTESTIKAVQEHTESLDRSFEAFREEQKELTESIEKYQKHEDAFFEGFNNVLNYSMAVAYGKEVTDDGK